MYMYVCKCRGMFINKEKLLFLNGEQLELLEIWSNSCFISIFEVAFRIIYQCHHV